ncbi:hypothetical protein EK21DRAFT_106289 [Setomelanomma holmii]|uniref:Uncharacterized protein n=1 Tax=Setomelanomma holmii TaxID=210430 RepID=A0A9P4HNG8_9PLEO|nr:hypothetical protein EK21DRAFT_106289 [Setomelanomma holmii]
MQPRPSLVAAGFTFSAHGKPFDPGTTTIDKIEFFHDEIIDLMKDYKHTFLGHGSLKAQGLIAKSEPYRTTLTSSERGTFKSRAKWLLGYVQDVLAWAEVIDAENLAEKESVEAGGRKT